ncbi:hypothetical protein HMN09_01400800 [Mycena chlorophos]|uniref:F-box domain-containing protein n=1 Tax=Mycena chlorophos TaxID=658473 RepID=A0A8H6VNL0_MYCCL|nr:hypothetical protein HMN09_01400800 [Mycena chlorophos]
MHPALRIPEIVSLIFETMVPDVPPQKADLDTHTLASLSRTCKYFSEPALNALWKKQRGLGNLLSCFPEDLWNVKYQDWKYQEFLRVPANLALVRNILPSDWMRAAYYAKRVRDVCIPEEAEGQLVLPFLSISLPTSPFLFPNLRTLEYNADDPALHGALPMLLPPTLKHVFFTTPNDIKFLSALPALPVRCPALTEIDFTSVETGPLNFYPRYCHAVSLLLLRFDRLERVCVDDLEFDALKHLADMPTLKAVKINFEQDESPLHHVDLSPGRLGVNPLPAITSIIVNPASHDMTVFLVSAVARRPLIELTIEMKYAVTPVVAGSLLAHLCDCINFEKIEILEISSTLHSGDSARNEALDPISQQFTHLLQRLQATPKTRLRITIHFPGVFRIKNQQLLEIGRTLGPTSLEDLTWIDVEATTQRRLVVLGSSNEDTGQGPRT